MSIWATTGATRSSEPPGQHVLVLFWPPSPHTVCAMPKKRSQGFNPPVGAGETLPVFPGFREAARARRRLLDDLVGRRHALGLSQTEVAARMGTSQSAVARLETVAGDVRLSTLERYADAVGRTLEWTLRPAADRSDAP